MNIYSVELQVHPGFAESFDLDTVHYGLVVHWRDISGTGTREVVEFRPFRSEGGGDPIEMPGVRVDRERLEFERGHDTDIDRRLIRRSVFKVEFASSQPLGRSTLQRAFIVVKAKGGSAFSSRLGLTLHLTQSSSRAVECHADGPEPQLLWATGEWKDDTTLSTNSFHGDIAAYVADIQTRVNDVSTIWRKSVWTS